MPAENVLDRLRAVLEIVPDFALAFEPEDVTPPAAWGAAA